MSPQEREVVGKGWNSLWDDYALVEKGRNKFGEATAFVNDFPGRLEANGGDLAEVFCSYVDELLYGDEPRSGWPRLLTHVMKMAISSLGNLKRYERYSRPV